MERLRSWLFVVRWRAHDHFKYRSTILSWLLFVAWALIPRGRADRWRFLLAAHRHSYNDFIERRILRHRDAIIEYAQRAIAPGTDIDGSSERAFYERAIVLKEPVHEDGALIERGVLLIKFTNSFVYLQRHFDVPALLDRFYLVLEPSWSGYAQPPILAWLRYRQPILIQASEVRDRRLIERLGGNLVPLPIGSSDWVDHRVFCPLPDHTKDFDAVLVGDAGLTKRIHVYLRAVAHVEDPDYHCALVIGNWGAYRRQVLALIDYYRVGDRVTVFPRMSQRDLNVLLNRSKVNLLLSLKEGSNRALFEGFFAGTPALLLGENVGVNKEYINEHTGRLIEERALPAELRRMKEHWDRYRPREWALEHISFARSTARIAEQLRPLSESEGFPFTGPLYEKVNVPEACYPDDPDGSARHRLLDEYLTPLALDRPRDAASAAPHLDRVTHGRQAGA